MLEAHAVSVTYTDSEDQPLYEPAPGETPIWDKVTVVALFPDNTLEAEIEEKLSSKLSNSSLATRHYSLLEDQDWERAWLKDFKPVCFGGKLWVCPADLQPPASDGVIMKLDPGLAFGTGSHPTTALCLHWLAEQKLEKLSLIDYGCGSGILGIAALLLGADIVHGVDNDPQALTATQDNCSKNTVDHAHFPLYLPGDFAHALTTGKVQQVDIVVANILAGPLVSLAQYLSAMVKPEGQILLSGILREQAQEVMAAYANWFSFSEPAFQGDWSRLTGLRKS